MGHPRVKTLREPLEKWNNINNVNLLELMYNDAENWAFEFQTYVMATMIENHLSSAKVKILERSLASVGNFFLKAHEMKQTIHPAKIRIFEDLHKKITGIMPAYVHIIIYLQTEPKMAFERMKKRDRKEEHHVTIEYLQLLHNLHEKWLLSENVTKVIVIDADQSIENIMYSLEKKNWRNEKKRIKKKVCYDQKNLLCKKVIELKSLGEIKSK